jgi:hypothetical protein
MVRLFPGGLIVLQKGEEASATQFGSRCFDEKGASATRPDEGIDLFDQLIGKDDMCSL